MRLTLDDYVNRDVDPNSPYEAQATVGDEFLEAALLDPALMSGSSVVSPAALEREMTFMVMRDVARQQQHIVFDMARNVGILQPFARTTVDALQYVDFSIGSLSPQSIQNSMLGTGIGIAANALSAIPNLYAQIAALVLDFSVSLVAWLQKLLGIDQPIAQPVRALFPTQEYSDEVDSDLFNHQVRLVMRSSYDWSSIFMPRYTGQLSSLSLKNEIGQRSVGWGLGYGENAKILWPRKCPSGHRDEGKNKCWDFTPTGPQSQVFRASDGLGMVPGGQRIFGIVQTTALMSPTGPRTGHPSMYDPRCGGEHRVERIDIGSYYPTTTQGAMSIWDFVFQVGPAMYTIDAIGLAEGRAAGNDRYEIHGWKRYLKEIWEGVVELWRNPEYEHRWGCSFWKGALQQLVQNYTVSNFGVGVLSWTPSTNDKLSLADQDAWEKHNVYEKVIKEALWKLHAAQLTFLGKSNIAAYLPIYGGVKANPLQQEKVMGSMREYVIHRAFVEARERILKGDSKYNVVLADVLDPVFRQQIKDAGGGKGDRDVQTLQFVPEALAIPVGGLGLPPKFETPKFETQPSKGRKPWGYMAAGAGALALTGLGYYFWDDLAALMTTARERLPRLPRRSR